MTKNLLLALSLCGLLCLVNRVKAQNEQTLYHLASYETNTEAAAEVVAYDSVSKQAFFTSSVDNNFNIVDISNPKNPTLVTAVSLETYGAGPNSIAVKNGIVAVAVESAVKQDAGCVVLFSTDGAYLNTITVGALPDMVTFTPDGTKVLVANEGEPSDDYTVDPEGSISVIDLSAGVENATTATIDFTSYNDKKQHLINKGIRIFGNDGAATVAQDLEPEYIAVTPDGTMAYVSCQEANAFAVIDLSDNTILDIQPLGYKNHALGTPSITLYNINELASSWPALGTPEYGGGQSTVYLGGFSGLCYADRESTNDVDVFYTIPDRGPNDATVKKATVAPTPSQNLRPFKLPDYQSRVVKFSVNETTGEVTLDKTILLVQKDSVTPISGKGNVPGYDEVPVTYTDATTVYADTSYVADGVAYHALSYDAYGGDFEGILIDKNNTFWMCDEYRPAIYHFDTTGILIERYVAKGTSLLGDSAQTEGYYGAETLPEVYSKRRANRGFEGIAYDSVNHILYAFIQSPMYNPGSSTKNNSDVIRILGVDANNGTPVAEYVYLLERNRDAGFATSRVDKIGDAVYKENGKLVVIERDSQGPDVVEGKKYLFEVDINYATNILDSTFSGKELEEMTADEIVEAGITPVHKNKILNLPTLGYVSSDKAEGIVVLPDNKLAVMNDNDFGLAGAGITDNSVLGIISFENNYGFDASNKDDSINITNHPTLGMFMPDGIACYSVDGANYIVTANEGDSKDYDGYSEEERVKDITLNTEAGYYPNAESLQVNEDLGRLKTTTATGDYNNDGIYEQIYSYGTRSFSVFDAYGNIVFDSGDDFAQTIAFEEPELFNEDEGELDGRSDDKGCEPEAIAIGTIGDYTYAFIGTERQSAIFVYDITNPKQPEFIDYYNDRENASDVSPEIIKFISADESPNNENLLLVGYEVSGSLGIIQVGGELSIVSKVVAGGNFKVYPNPVVNSRDIHFSKTISGTIFSVNGQKILDFENTNSISSENMEEGVYIVKTLADGVKRFVVIK